jgi:hypothetical protein
MNLDEQLEDLESAGETDAELIDQQTEIYDAQDDEDEIFGEDAEETDVERAYEGFSTEGESDYDGWDDADVADKMHEDERAEALNSEGYHVEDVHELEEEVIEMEIEDGDIYAYLVDEDDNQIGFILLDEDGNEQEYYYVDMDQYEVVDDGSDGSDPEPHTKVKRASDDEEFDLGITREGVAETTADLNAIYKDGVAIAGEFKEVFDDINESLSFLTKKPGKK